MNWLHPMHYTPVYILIVTLMTTSCTNNSDTQRSDKADAEKKIVPATEKKTILFFGNSLTAGYGLDDPSEAFPGLIQQKIDSLKLPYTIINAGLSGETSSAGNERIEWLLKQKIDIFVLELGANDGLRGVSPDETYKNLGSIADQVQQAWPDCKILLAGMLVPPNMGPDYSNKFKAVFPRLAKEKNMQLVPFLLDQVAGVSDLNQNDGIHPTKEGHKILAANVWQILKGML